jgi:L-lactate permease
LGASASFFRGISCAANTVGISMAEQIKAQAINFIKSDIYFVSRKGPKIKNKLRKELLYNDLISVLFYFF